MTVEEEFGQSGSLKWTVQCPHLRNKISAFSCWLKQTAHFSAADQKFLSSSKCLLCNLRSFL